MYIWSECLSLDVVENREGHEQPEKRKFEELSDSDNGDNDSSLGLEEALEMYHSDDDPDYKVRE